MEAPSQEICFMALKQNSTIFSEEHSTMRPPLFTNYSYWGTRMKLFIQANDYEVWRIITNGPSILIKRVEGAIVQNEESEWDALGKTYPNKEMVKKILNSLPTSWEAKVMVIEESKDPNSLSLDKLIGSLLTYEMKINHSAQEIKEAPKKVGVAFKSTTCEKDDDSSNYDDD
ncbi:hypothetical protein Gotur_026890 [Gossypium turneri]